MKWVLPLSFLIITLTSCELTEAPSAGLAKEMCSCLFVSEQTEEYCRLVTKESGILANWEADHSKQEVTASGMGYTSVAAMDEDSRFGCTLKTVNSDPDARD